jgi:hypothetical protein
MRKFGNKLKVGDTIKVWWSSYDGQKGLAEDTITKLTRYDGLPHVFKKGARIAEFQFNRMGMTIPNDEVYDVIKNEIQDH